jgi:hypothetical protein
MRFARADSNADLVLAVGGGRGRGRGGAGGGQGCSSVQRGAAPPRPAPPRAAPQRTAALPAPPQPTLLRAVDRRLPPLGTRRHTVGSPTAARCAPQPSALGEQAQASARGRSGGRGWPVRRRSKRGARATQRRRRAARRPPLAARRLTWPCQGPRGAAACRRRGAPCLTAARRRPPRAQARDRCQDLDARRASSARGRQASGRYGVPQPGPHGAQGARQPGKARERARQARAGPTARLRQPPRPQPRASLPAPPLPPPPHPHPPPRPPPPPRCRCCRTARG